MLFRSVTAPVAIAEAIDGALLLLRDRINRLEASVIVNPELSETIVIAEGVRLEQVLVNLLQNSLDAGGHGSQIRIDLAMNGTYLEARISDDGPGLSESARATLFQPFSTSKREGLGLGLVICRDIMADFGGDLIAGTPSRGAEFILRLICAA